MGYMTPVEPPTQQPPQHHSLGHFSFFFIYFFWFFGVRSSSSSSVAFFLRAWLSGFVCFVVREKCLLFQLCYQWLSKHTHRVWSIFCDRVWFLICLHSNQKGNKIIVRLFMAATVKCPTGRDRPPSPPIPKSLFFSHFLFLVSSDAPYLVETQEFCPGELNFVWILLRIY